MAFRNPAKDAFKKNSTKSRPFWRVPGHATRRALRYNIRWRKDFHRSSFSHGKTLITRGRSKANRTVQLFTGQCLMSGAHSKLLQSLTGAPHNYAGLLVQAPPPACYQMNWLPAWANKRCGLRAGENSSLRSGAHFLASHEEPERASMAKA